MPPPAPVISREERARRLATAECDKVLQRLIRTLEKREELEKFKEALNAVRLQPDEFPLLVPEHWATGGDSSPSSRELVPYTLRINARSQLTFVPMLPPSTARSNSTSKRRRLPSAWQSRSGGHSGQLTDRLRRSERLRTRAV